MSIKLKTTICLTLLVIVGHTISKSLGWYGDIWFTDVMLHTLSGAAFACFWLHINRKSDMPTPLESISAILAAATGSLLWEFWEFSAWKIVPTIMIYHLDLSDTLEDMLCGVIGGTIIASIYFLFKNTKPTHIKQ